MLTNTEQDIALAREAFTKISWLLYNCSYDDFEDIYTETHGPAVGKYVEDLFYEARRNPAQWLLNVDQELQEGVIKAALTKYANSKSFN